MKAEGRRPFRLTMATERWSLKAPFRISGHVFSTHDTLLVELSDGVHTGRGEGAGVYYRDDRVPGMTAQVETVRGAVESGISREDLQALLPPGGARNAIDCALWDLEAKRAGKPVWELAGLEAPRPLVTTFTLGAEPPESVAAGAAKATGFQALKLKLSGDGEDAERVRRLRGARPDVWLGVDANQGLDRAGLEALIPVFEAEGVSLIEQPLPVGREADLEGLNSPIPIAADESVQGLKDVPGLVGRFDIVNIKLDKCGGLTEALAIAAEAQRLGLGVMVGNMIGTSLAMAPSFIVGQKCSVVDLDGPLHLTADRAVPADYSGGTIACPDALWGGAR